MAEHGLTTGDVWALLIGVLILSAGGIGFLALHAALNCKQSDDTMREWRKIDGSGPD